MVLVISFVVILTCEVLRAYLLKWIVYCFHYLSNEPVLDIITDICSHILLINEVPKFEVFNFQIQKLLFQILAIFMDKRHHNICVICFHGL